MVGIGFRVKHLRPRWIALALVVLDLGLVLAGKVGLLALLISLGLGVWGLARVGAIMLRRSRIIWRLRNRLVVTYVFIAIVPTLLLLALAYIGGYFVTGQMAAYLVNTALDRRAETLAGSARALGNGREGARPQAAAAIVAVLRERMPEMEIFVSGKPDIHLPPESTLTAPNPAWHDFTGTMVRDGRSWSTAIFRGENATAVLMAPLTPAILKQLVPDIGTLSLLDAELTGVAAPRLTAPTVRKGAAGIKVDGVAIDPNPRSVGTVPAATSFLDLQITWPGPVRIALWDSPNQMRSTFVVVTTRPSAVLGIVFASGIDFAQNILIFFAVIAALFAFVELISVLIGVFMTRTITGAVHNLYEGTLRVAAGDFSSRIPVKGAINWPISAGRLIR